MNCFRFRGQPITSGDPRSRFSGTPPYAKYIVSYFKEINVKKLPFYKIVQNPSLTVTHKTAKINFITLMAVDIIRNSSGFGFGDVTH